MRLPSSHLVVALLGYLLLQLNCQPSGVAPTLTELHGCDDVWHEPGALPGDGGTYVCALAESSGQTVRLWVQATAPAGVVVTSDRAPPGHRAAPQLTAAGRLVVDVERAQLPELVTLTEQAPFATLAARPAVHLRFVKQARLPIEETAEVARAQKKIGEGISTLRAALQAPPYSTEPAAKARLLHALADLEYDATLYPDSLHHFEQTLALAIPAGLTLITANSARRLAFLHYKLRRDIPKALEILAKYDAAIRMIDIEAVLVLYNRGVYAQERGHLSDAVRLLAAAKNAVKDLGEDGSRRLIAVMYAVALAQQGLTDKAELEVQEMLAELRQPGGSFDVCERMRILNTLGWTRILAAESHSPGARDPIPLFRQALGYRVSGSCAGDVQNVAMNWARAELLIAEQLAESAITPPNPPPTLSTSSPPTPPSLATEPSAELRGHLQTATEHLAEGTADAVGQSTSNQLDALELRGRIAYLRSNFADAETQFAALAALSRSAEEPDYQARALIGQALVSAALARTADAASADHYTQAAQAAFERAETQLDERLGFVPLTATRRAFLPRFTAGTAAFLEFLIAHNDLPRALEVARRAQVRGLVATLAFDTLNLLPKEQRLRLQREREAFASLPADDKAATRSFETLLNHLRDAGLGKMPLRPLQPGEAMHLCHPLPHGELACFVADKDSLQLERLSAQAAQLAKTTTDPEQQAKLLLAPFARLIDRAKVLRVLPSPGLRGVNFPALPWTGDSGYLSSEKRLVVYALDLELGARPQVPPQIRGQALMLTNLNLQHAQKSAPGLFDRLRQLGWQVTPYTNQRFDHGSNPRRRLLCWLGIESCPEPLELPVATQPGTAAAMKLALPAVELAQLDTHAHYESASGWESTLLMPDRSRLSVFELLTLTGAPRWTVLLVCDGGKTGKDQDADDISLAQALLLRGGEAVVASTRPLEDELSSRWSQALYGAKDAPTTYLGAAQPSLPEAFRAAQATLRRQRAPQSDWSALRLFVP